jgi:ATP-dependent Clp protease protease subunit
LIGKFSGHSREEIEEVFRRDRFLNSVEAKQFGLIDEVLGDTDDLVFLPEDKITDRERIGFKQHSS